MRWLHRLVAGMCVALVAGSALAQQRLIQIPPVAKRAEFTFLGGTDVLIDGRANARLAPGVRIFGRDNLLVMWGALSGSHVVRFTIEETTGLVMNVWLLTDEEIARPDPKSAN
jgi:hypothetical protein